MAKWNCHELNMLSCANHCEMPFRGFFRILQGCMTSWTDPSSTTGQIQLNQPCASLYLKDQYFGCLKWERVSLSGTNFCLEGDGDLKRNPTLHEYVYWEGVTQLRIFLSPLYLYNQLDSFLKKHFHFLYHWVSTICIHIYKEFMVQ